MKKIIFINTGQSVINVSWASWPKRAIQGAIQPSSAFTLCHAGSMYVVHRVDGPAETIYRYNKVSYYNYFNGCLIR